ncbi:hypothetical protein DSO57_1021631 [Entomophthora muscae]|uniref:Uncharacterized protein n=1 Tax=Entomophthora muscae TaxID=34485 RepID=A0ACC2S5A3_9FUNG|nr:hypothetical protein DSO57_1021631 [Entomophthora muscae]
MQGNMDGRQKFLVAGYFLYLAIGCGLSFYAWVGLTHSGCAAVTQYFSGGSATALEKAMVVAFMPGQLLLNLASDIYHLSLFPVLWMWRGAGNVSMYSSTTAFCLVNNIRVIAGVPPVGSGVKGDQIKTKIRRILATIPGGTEHAWSSLEEGMALVRKFSKHQKVAASIQHEYADAESRVGSLLTYAEGAIGEVFHGSSQLVQLARDAYEHYLANYPIIQPANDHGYAPTPLFEAALAEHAIAFKDLRKEVASILRDQLEMLRTVFQTKKDYRRMEAALAFIANNTMLEGSILSTSAARALKVDLRSQFHKEASHIIHEHVVMSMSNAETIQDALFYTAKAVLNDLQIIRQLPTLHTPINYAQLSEGAAVISIGTSPSANKGDVADFELMSIHSSTAHRHFNIPMLFDPRNAITPGTDLEEPWLMKSSSGTLNIRLTTPIIPCFIALHSPSPSQEPHPTSNPKHIEIWASTTSSQILLAKHTHPLQPDAIDIINLNNPLPAIKKISFKVFTNHGNPNYTKIYQISVYGFPSNL